MTARSTRRRLVVAPVLVVSALLGVGACGGGDPEPLDVPQALDEASRAQAEGRTDVAEERFDAVVEAEPGNRVALFNLGILRRARGDLGGSLAAFDELVDADPKFTPARYQRAITHQSAGDLEAAIADFRVVVEQDPENRTALQQLGALLVATGAIEEGQSFLAQAEALRPEG